MSRTFSNYLLFEGVLDSLVDSGTGIVQSMAKNLITPTVKVVEEDCGTSLGTYGEVSFGSEGEYTLSQPTPLTYQNIYDLLQLGKYQARFRKTSSCISKGGVCRTCLQGSMIGEVTPQVGEYTKIIPEFNYTSEHKQGSGSAQSYSLRNDFDIAKLVIDGQVQDIVLAGTESIAVDTSNIFLFKYYSSDSSSLLGYLGRSFSGGLLGINPLPTPPLFIRESLFNSILSNAQISILEEEVSNLGNVEDRYLDYAKGIHSKLEKSLFLLFIFAVFSDIIF